jgi:hypothetical protein
MPIRKRTIDLARAYVDQHFGVRYLFPIKPGAKFPPLIKNNLADASSDPAQLEAWEKQWPGCNWGVAHRKSKLLVADIDTNQAKGKIGQATFDGLDLIYGWPETETTTTPSGGFHKIYEGWANDEHPEHIMALGENGIGKDIDSPNYSLIPGCTFDDGTSYVGNGLDAVKCPEWIYNTIKMAKVKSRIADAGEIVIELDQERNIALAIDFLINDAEPSIQGQGGDNNLLKAAYYLKDIGISQQLGAELLNEYFNPRCQPPWDMEDFEKKMAGAYTYANLSKVGGKTAEADFADEPMPKITRIGQWDKETKSYKLTPTDDEKAIAQRNKEAKERRQIAKKEAETPDAEKPKKWDKPEVLDTFVWVSGIERFVMKRDTKIMWKKSSFDAHFSHLNNAKGAPKSYSDYLFKLTKGTIPRFEELVFKPGMPQVIDGRQFNTYTWPTVLPTEGDVSWWDEHIAYLFPNEADRNYLLNWLAWLVQNIALKPKHALLMQGPIQGTGKSFIVEVVSEILHPRNVKNVSQADLHSAFNGWALRSKLIVVEELRAVERNEVANKLHPLVTQETISINEKNLPQQEADNCFGIFAMTNSDAAISIDKSDRRYLVLRTDAEPRQPSYYASLYAKLDDPAALSAVAFALRNRDVGEYDGRQAAPRTAAKEAMIEAGASDLETYLMDHAGDFPMSSRIVTTEDIVTVLPKRLEGRGARIAATIKSILISRFGGVELGQCPLPDGSRRRLIAINGSAGILTKLETSQIGKLYEEDKKRAGKGQPLEEFDEAGNEFSEE